ncbi:hypothetical protein ACFQ1E_19150 [Sphingomonas canadensis]|uniref:DUF3429 domain-containing protein n=1 Tax=Sphingomonas canadensis TaxID=1219257 RepID=A0ABW3HBJ6_9SPHN|nr:hypothetical protein [Sphingomonas canadensis]MCW3838199.1 hypothetical protein [Sphingomonas canadensis]
MSAAVPGIVRRWSPLLLWPVSCAILYAILVAIFRTLAVPGFDPWQLAISAGWITNAAYVATGLDPFRAEHGDMLEEPAPSRPRLFEGRAAMAAVCLLAGAFHALSGVEPVWDQVSPFVPWLAGAIVATLALHQLLSPRGDADGRFWERGWAMLMLGWAAFILILWGFRA